MQDDRDKPGCERYAYSKCRIKNIHSLKSWKTLQITTPISFPDNLNMIPPTFNYFDYIEAWRNFLLVRPYTHTWFIQIKTELPEPIPRWFYLWWKKFGICAKILPTDKLNRFDGFMAMPTKNMTGLDKQMMFFFKVKFPWIVVWEFTKVKNEYQHITLARLVRVKWWVQYNEHRQNSASTSSIVEQKMTQR